MRFSRLLAAALLLAALTACGSVPRPFSPGAKSGGLPPPGPSSALIVHPVAGVETDVLDRMTRLIVSGLQQKQVAAIPYEVPNRYRIIGQAIAVDSTAGRSTLEIHWQLTEPDRTPLREDLYNRDVDAEAWRSGDPALVRALADEAVERIAVLIGMAAAAAPEPAAPEGPDLRLAPIKRAPGDGAEALAGAMASELERFDLQTAPDDGLGQVPVLEALVSVSPMDASNDLVRIIWLLRDGSGRERGRLEQQNTVPSGRLARRWGVVAQLAAAAAAPGIADLVEQLRRTAQ
ncbi:MAG: hypothetical protein ACMVY4_22435 [Minwuia sp.]|uniref:hypothetical protein n=1 Tax=Minwuia sp. TaxID=2493630 RepID=UPI003A89EE41